MADFASSIITITQTSLTIIKEIKKFIEQVRLVDTLVNKLLTEFKDLYSLIKVVHSTYKRALTGEHVGTSNFVGQCLLKCRDKLGQMKELVVQLASQDTDTFFRRLSVQRRYEAIRKDIATGTEEIHKYIQHIRTGIECWNLYVENPPAPVIFSDKKKGCCYCKSPALRGNGSSESRQVHTSQPANHDSITE